MPWHTVDNHSECPTGKPYAVVQDSNGHVAGCHTSEEEAHKQMAALYANEPHMMRAQHAQVELRTAGVDSINFPERIISVIAAPYEQPAQVVYNNEWWTETIERSAFAGLTERKYKLRVNREHDRLRTVGKVMGYYPDKPEGLVIDAYISNTLLGNETLELARDGILSGSVGMLVRASDQQLDRHRKTRRIQRAFLDHLAFTAEPAYEGAEVIGVRSADAPDPDASPKTPALDEFWSDPMFRWAAQRLSEERTED